jgi:hypothetical protein
MNEGIPFPFENQTASAPAQSEEKPWAKKIRMSVAINLRKKARHARIARSTQKDQIKKRKKTNSSAGRNGSKCGFIVCNRDIASRNTKFEGEKGMSIDWAYMRNG